MSEQDLPRNERRNEDGEDTHPLEAGIEAAKDDDTASLEEILQRLD